MGKGASQNTGFRGWALKEEGKIWLTSGPRSCSDNQERRSEEGMEKLEGSEGEFTFRLWRRTEKE